MESLLEHLEENLEDESLEEMISYMNEFKDGDLAMYPAIEIKEQQLSAEECEIIANNIINAISLADEDTIEKPARALVALAYNSLMDPGQEISWRRSVTEKPFFHKDELKLTENWLRICAKSDLDLKDYLSNTSDTPEDQQKLKLISSKASDFERKASIGAWAYYHLKLICNARGFFWSGVIADRFRRTIHHFYGFDATYKFPVFSYEAYKLLRDRLMIHKSGETLYLLYRSMIIVESSVLDHNAPQKRLLRRLVFDGPHGLFDGRLWLWTWFRSAAFANTPHIPFDRLFDELGFVLDQLDDEDPGYSKFTSLSRSGISHLREFHDKYTKKVTPGSNLMKSKYFKYAKLVNEYYFQCMRLRANRELICTLMFIFEKRSGTQIRFKPMRAPWRRWGDEMGARVYHRIEPDQDLSECFNRVVTIKIN